MLTGATNRPASATESQPMAAGLRMTVTELQAGLVKLLGPYHRLAVLLLAETRFWQTFAKLIQSPPRVLSMPALESC